MLKVIVYYSLSTFASKHMFWATGSLCLGVDLYARYRKTCNRLVRCNLRKLEGKIMTQADDFPYKFMDKVRKELKVRQKYLPYFKCQKVRKENAHQYRVRQKYIRHFKVSHAWW